YLVTSNASNPARSMNRNWSRRTWPVARNSPKNPYCSRRMRAWLKARPSLNTGNTRAISARRSRWGASSDTRRSLGQITPVGAARRSRPGSARSRPCGTRTAWPSGMGASSSQRRKSSATTLLALTSRIDTLLEWLDAEALDGIDEQLVGRLSQLKIGGGDILDHVRHLGVGHGRP